MSASTKHRDSADAGAMLAIDADGHVMERAKDVRRHLKSPWNRRETPLFPGDQPWDMQMLETIQPYMNYHGDLEPEQQVAIWNKVLKDHRIEKAVLFPSWTHTAPKLQEADFAAAVCAAVNALFAKEFRTDALRPVGLLPIRTATDAVREMQRSVNELGITAFTLPTNGLPFALGDPYYDIVYEEAQKLGARLCVHGSRNWAREFGGDKLRTFAEVHSYAFTAGILLQFTSIVCQGVTERFPELRLAFLEIGATWLPYYLDRLDEHWVKRRSEMPHLSRSPSAAFRDSHMKISIEADETLLAQTIEYGGAEHFFFATDIPHWDSEFPRNLAALRATNSLDPAAKQKLLYSNAKEFYAL